MHLQVSARVTAATHRQLAQRPVTSTNAAASTVTMAERASTVHACVCLDGLEASALMVYKRALLTLKQLLYLSTSTNVFESCC